MTNPDITHEQRLLTASQSVFTGFAAIGIWLVLAVAARTYAVLANGAFAGLVTLIAVVVTALLVIMVLPSVKLWLSLKPAGKPD